jgi:uroporphyrinogen decarboxylase
MIEGSGSSDFALVRKMAHARPDLLAHIVDVNARSVAAYLDAQIESGADAVMVFDTWGGLLTADAYRTFSLAPMRTIVDSLRDRVPTIVFTRGGGGWLGAIAEIGAHCVGLDWTVDIAAARRAIGGRVSVQGNLDPVALLTDPATVAREAERIVRAAGPAPGHVFNLGHGIVPATPPENVAALVEAVHRISREMRAGA